MRYFRLKEIKRVRRLRDELLSTDNLGRATTLLMKLPNITWYGRDVYDQYYGSGRRINIELRGGYEYTFAGYGYMIEYVKEAAEFVYKDWLKKI